jgi:hypothetical protein
MDSIKHLNLFQLETFSSSVTIKGICPQIHAPEGGCRTKALRGTEDCPSGFSFLVPLEQLKRSLTCEETGPRNQVRRGVSSLKPEIAGGGSFVHSTFLLLEKCI